MTHIIDEIRKTEYNLAYAEERYNQLWEMTDIGHTLTMDALKKVETEMKRLESVMNILSAHLGMLEADLEEASFGMAEEEAAIAEAASMDW